MKSLKEVIRFSMTKKSLNKSAKFYEDNKDTIVDIVENHGKLLTETLKVITTSVIDTIVSEKDNSINFYKRNQKGIDCIIDGISLLMTDENKKYYKQSYVTMLNNINTAMDEHQPEVLPMVDKVVESTDKLVENFQKFSDELAEMM